MRGDAVRRLAKNRFGVHSARAIGDLLGIDGSTMARLLAGRNQPSGIVVATVLDGLDARFDEVFAIVADDPEPIADAA
jgi:hypothetical protein